MVKYNVMADRDRRYKAGQSGNPNGRPKKPKQATGSQNEITELLNEKVPYNEGGRIKHMTLRQALMRRVAKEGVTGSSKIAIEALRLDLAAKKLHGCKEMAPTPEENALAAHSRETGENIIRTLNTLVHDNSGERYGYIQALLGYQPVRWLEANKALLPCRPELIDQYISGIKDLEIAQRQMDEEIKKGNYPTSYQPEHGAIYERLARECETHQPEEVEGGSSSTPASTLPKKPA